jgi:hypothetical protein
MVNFFLSPSLPQLGWSIALGPWKQLPLNVFVLWMAGNTISLFPIMMVGMMLVRPVQTLFGYKEGEREKIRKRERSTWREGGREREIPYSSHI